jgi:hypothetical protein
MSGAPSPPMRPPKPAPPKHAPQPAKPNVFDTMMQPERRKVNLAQLSPKHIRKVLQSKGYDIPLVGGMNSRLRGAMDAYINGKPPKQYNDWAAKKYVSVVVKGASPTRVAAGGGGVLTAPGGGAAPKPSKAPVVKKGGAGIDLSTLGNIGANIGVDTPEAFADAIAQGESGQAVTDAQRQIDQAPGQYAQNTHDIGHWYDQVLASQATAAGRDKDIGAAGTGSIRDAVAAMVASLGGSANEGSGQVASTGQMDADMMQALATNQDQYNQDIRPLMQAEAAGAQTRETVRQSNDMRDLQNKLTDAKTAKGAARIRALMQIRQQNNALAQQRFENQLNLSNAREAAMMNGLKIASAGQVSVSPNTLAKASNGAMNQFVAYDDQGNQLPGYNTKKYNPQQVVKMVNNSYLGMGLNLKDPRVAQSAMATLRGLGINPDPRWYG